MTTERRGEGRLRPHPTVRFAPPERKIDLDRCYDELIEEHHNAVDGHRQITIAHNDAMTLTFFHFEEGGCMPEHVVDGAVTIYVLDGYLEVETDEEIHHLEDDQLLILAPNVEHDVRAVEDSRMLLTVYLNRKEERTKSNQRD